MDTDVTPPSLSPPARGREFDRFFRPHLSCDLRFLLLIVLFLGSCATQTAPPTTSHVALSVVPGFWEGMWHGLISWIMLISEPFDPHRIYAYPNTGKLYDLGWMIGCSFWFGIRYQGK
jgi:hypothetical protein